MELPASMIIVNDLRIIVLLKRIALKHKHTDCYWFKYVKANTQWCGWSSLQQTIIHVPQPLILIISFYNFIVSMMSTYQIMLEQKISCLLVYQCVPWFIRVYLIFQFGILSSRYNNPAKVVLGTMVGKGASQKRQKGANAPFLVETILLRQHFTYPFPPLMIKKDIGFRKLLPRIRFKLDTPLMADDSNHLVVLEKLTEV